MGEVEKTKMERSSPPVAGEVVSKVLSLDSSFDAKTSDDDNLSITERKNSNIFVRMVDSFRQPEDLKNYEHLSKQEKALLVLSRSKPHLAKRHLMIIAASSCVGTGLFIGSGSSLALGGPAALLIGFGVMGIAMICVMSTIGELSLRYPTISPFYELPARFLDPSFGFACGWMYAFCWMVTAPLELIAGAQLTQYWHNDNNSAAHVNPVAWVALLWAFDVFINVSGSRAYGELEFIVGLIKVSGVIGFILFSIINVAGGPPTDHYIGGHNFYNPRPFMNGFKGVVQVLVSCSFAYGGTEVSSIAATETANPVKAIPSAVRQVFWRILVFFIVGMLMVGLMVPPTTPNLGNSQQGGSGSPLILALSLTGVRALPSIMNAIIICSVIGVSNAAIYAASRSLTSLAIKGAAPSYLCYIDRQGRPIGALGTVLTFSLLCFVAASDKYNDVFNWLYAFAALAFLFAWSSVCMCYVRFRLAMKLQGRSLSELLYKSNFGIPGAIIGGGVNIAVLGLQFWIYLFPIGKQPDPSYFFQGDLSIPVFIALFVGHKIWYWKTSKIVPTKDLDLDSGVREIDWDLLHAMQEEDAIKNKRNPLRRLAQKVC